MEPQEHLKRDTTNKVVECFLVATLNIRKALMLCAWIFGIVHPQDMKNYRIDYLCFSISLWVEGSLIGQLGVHH
jgi:hypothetical protein